MRAKIKKRLLDQSGEPEPQPEPQVVRQRVPEPQVQPQPAVVQPQRPAVVQANTESTHSVFYDIIIAVIVLIIAILLFRRFSLYNSPETASAAPQPPADADDLL